MKDKRNCNNNNMNYPVYPGFQNFGGPMMVPPMGYPNQGFGTMPNYGGVTTNTIEQQINNLSEQINQLEQRVTRLERQYMNNSNNYNNKYNDSNYYMV